MEPQLIREIRAFNRFYTRIAGLVNDHILNSPYSLPEARMQYELNHHPGMTSSELTALLGIDKGYLSRIVKQFEAKGLVSRTVSAADRRIAALSLTAKGRKEFGMINRASDEQVGNAFKNLPEKDCRALVEKMLEIQHIITRNKILP
jgi:DNA-binding MarR family transcriptional regulator